MFDPRVALESPQLLLLQCKMRVAVHGGGLDFEVFVHSNWAVGEVTLTREVTVADPVHCRLHAQKCVRFAQRARSARERRALLTLARRWSSLAAQTEAYEAIVCKLVEPAPAGDEKSFKPKAHSSC
jgi:hypothetical protein